MYILSIILGLMVVAYVFKITFSDYKLNDIIILVLSILFFCYVVGDNTKAYKDGYNDAIHDAELVGIDQDVYQLDFNGQVHNYTFGD